jgi:hypothetical protein
MIVSIDIWTMLGIGIVAYFFAWACDRAGTVQRLPDLLPWAVLSITLICFGLGYLAGKA